MQVERRDTCDSKEEGRKKNLLLEDRLILPPDNRFFFYNLFSNSQAVQRTTSV